MEAEVLAGRYELRELVGKGATGRVWQGFDTLLQRAVAIKLVDFEGARDPAVAERFRREGVAIAALNIDVIVKVFDTGADARRGWLVMELLSGPNLNTLVKEQGPLSYEVGMPLLARVAGGLQAAHDAGVTHRDVKPANIVMDAPARVDGTRPDLMTHPGAGRPVLVDFGIARIVDEAGSQLTRPATAIGTAAYMSPEQARGRTTGPASDVYSLACVAYHIFLGRPPFVADNSLAVAHAQAFDAPVPLAELSPDAPPALDTLLARMLSKNPGARPSAREVAAELRAISADPKMAPTVALSPQAAAVMGTAAPTLLMDEVTARTPTVVPAMPPARPVSAMPPMSVPRPDGPSQRGFHNAGRWLVGLLIVAMLAGLVYLWLNREPQAPPDPTVTLTTTSQAPSPTTEPPSTQQTPSKPPSTQPPTSAAPPTTATTLPPTSEAPEPTDTVPPTGSVPAPETTNPPEAATAG